ncbi:putative sulfate exporter family transporter [Actinotignum timonense]|uniref:YeiH family protein n=1 Tax=Actinotignum timonense TaxID=1870995 RepID=UPI00254CD5E2|nr:putative sulfate exporter family transporter [Actinotignum timonense]MDK6927103.1 putative sulfate exporter family transporter [Actinotignum timonense]
MSNKNTSFDAATWAASLRALTPGVLLAALIAVASWGLSKLMPLLSAMLFAIVLGMLVRNLGLIPRSANRGLTFTSKRVLRTGVVLLGLRLSIPAILGLGWGTLITIITCVTATMLISVPLSKLLRVPHASAILTAVGTSICGASAVAGTSAVVRVRNEDERDTAAATAIACVTLFGTLTLVVLPWLAHLLDLSANQAAVWMGATIHEVGQVVAAANIYGGVADTATAAKLGRVVCLAAVIAVVGLLERAAKQREARAAGLDGAALDAHGHTRSSAPLIPLFVLGFLIAVGIASVLENQAWAASALQILGNDVANWLLIAAMGAMGAGVHLKTIMHTGARTVLFGFLLTLVIVGIGLACVAVFVV